MPSWRNVVVISLNFVIALGSVARLNVVAQSVLTDWDVGDPVFPFFSKGSRHGA